MSTTQTAETKQAPQASKPEPHPFAAFATFDPMALWAQSQQTFAKLMTEGFGRAQAFAEQYATIESQMLVRAQGAVASWAQLTQDAIAYSGQLTSEARKLSLDAAKKMSAGA